MSFWLPAKAEKEKKMAGKRFISILAQKHHWHFGCQFLNENGVDVVLWLNQSLPFTA